MQKGVDNPNFPQGIQRLDKMLADMDKALAERPWLVGWGYSLADVAYAAYVTRLDQLRFGGLMDRRPRVADWYERMRARPAYRKALAAHFNPKYLTLMTEKGDEAWPRVKELVAA